MPSIEEAHDFGPEFERVVARAALLDSAFLPRFRPILTPDAFQDETLRFLVETATGYVEQYDRMPAVEVLRDLIEQADFRDKGGAVEFLRESKPVDDLAYVQDRVISWAKWCAVQRVLRESDALKPSELAEQIDKAARTGDELLMNHTTLDDEAEGEGAAKRRIATPWPWLNDQLNGGPEIGDLCVVLTVINGGKTTALVNVAREVVRAGGFVAYLTFEDGETKIKRRLMQSITGMAVEEMMADPVVARKKRDAFMRESGGRCDIKDLSSRRSTVQDAAAFVRSLQDAAKRKVDVLITDYADRFRPPTKRSEIRHELREIFEECKWAARSLGVVHWTARQVGKERVGKEILSAEHAGESWGTMESPDLVVGFGQTLEDERRNRITCYTAKVRDAKKHQTRSMVADFERQAIFEPEAQ